MIHVKGHNKDCSCHECFDKDRSIAFAIILACTIIIGGFIGALMLYPVFFVILDHK